MQELTLIHLMHSLRYNVSNPQRIYSVNFFNICMCNLDFNKRKTHFFRMERFWVISPVYYIIKEFESSNEHYYC